MDVPLGGVQQVAAPDGVIPIPGCPDSCYNSIAPASQTLTATGRYPDIAGGSTFIMAVELTPTGPHGQTLLTYGESENVASTHHWDQTHLFSTKQWLPDRFTRAQIAADPSLTITQLPTETPDHSRPADTTQTPPGRLLDHDRPARLRAEDHARLTAIYNADPSCKPWPTTYAISPS